MADLLRRGATLTDLSCPACASPLFRLKDQTLWCEKDQKKVIVMKRGDEQVAAEKSTYNKIESIQGTQLNGDPYVLIFPNTPNTNYDDV